MNRTRSFKDFFWLKRCVLRHPYSLQPSPGRLRVFSVTRRQLHLGVGETVGFELFLQVRLLLLDQLFGARCLFGPRQRQGLGQ